MRLTREKLAEGGRARWDGVSDERRARILSMVARGFKKGRDGRWRKKKARRSRIPLGEDRP